MALPSSGPISLANVRSELGLSGAISLGQSNVRSLAGLASGAIAMSALRGKSAAPVVPGIGSFSLYASNYTSDSVLNTGYSSGYYGSVSPGSVLGAAILQMRLYRLTNTDGSYAYMIYFQLNTPGNTQTAAVRGINIGGITIAGYVTRDQDFKGANLNTCSFKSTNAAGWIGGVVLTVSQWQTIYNAILNKTTTVTLV